MNPNDFNQQSDDFSSDLTTDGEGAVLPLGIGDGESNGPILDPLAGAGPETRAKTGVLLLALVVVVAAGGLFFMRTVAKVTASQVGDDDVFQTINAFLNGRTETELQENDIFGRNGALGVLNEEYTERQVALSDVQRNPFVVGEAPVVPDTTGTADPGAGQARLYEQRRRERKATLEQAGASFELSSVLMGSTPLANIGNKIVRVGETIYSEQYDVAMRVAEIQNDMVVLVAEDPQYDVKVRSTLTIERD